jgi:hypothetical protein
MEAPSSIMTTINLTPVGEKLSRGNHVLWKTQVPAVLRGAQLIRFLDGMNKASAEKILIKSQKELEEETQEVLNPAFDLWKAQEQQVRSNLPISVSWDVLVQVAALPSIVDAWRHIETSFLSRSCTRLINTRMALATTQKGSSTIAEYISELKTLADDMA